MAETGMESLLREALGEADLLLTGHQAHRRSGELDLRQARRLPLGGHVAELLRHLTVSFRLVLHICLMSFIDALPDRCLLVDVEICLMNDGFQEAGECSHRPIFNVVHPDLITDKGYVAPHAPSSLLERLEHRIEALAPNLIWSTSQLHP
jgi:hypothetical protein